MSDMGVQLTSSQEERPTDRNKIDRQFQNVMAHMEEMINRHRWGGQGTGKLEMDFLEIASVVDQKSHYSIVNNAKNQTAGAVESQREIMPDARNLGLRLETESAKKEHSPSLYTPILAAVGGGGVCVGGGTFSRTECG